VAAKGLKRMITAPEILVAPGIYDALGGVIAEQAGFSAAYLSGASIAYTRFGRPDIGLVSVSEVADTLAAIADRIELPIIVDADTGFGNALNVVRTVRTFERSGASGIQLEDQSLPKRCGHLTGKSLISLPEMVGKLHAALDTRRSDETLIIARTDAIGVEGMAAALDRANAYAEAGADVIFVEAPRSAEELRIVRQAIHRSVPIMANMVEGGRTPMQTAQELQDLGYARVIFPGGLVRAISHAATAYFESLREHGTTQPFSDQMLDFSGLNSVIGTPEMLETGARYDGAQFEEPPHKTSRKLTGTGND